MVAISLNEKALKLPQQERIAAEFEIPYRQYLDPSAQLVGEPPEFARNPDTMTSLYRAMTLSRIFDAKAIALQRTGQLGTYPSSAGQEAIGVGYAAAMEARDVMLTTYREQPAQLWRGVTLVELLRFWGGDERGNDFAVPREDFPVAVPIASQAPQAAGVAAAFKLRKEPRVAVCALGDGASSKGDFYEAINLAGIWRLAVVFIIINNGWAISLPREKQTAAETLAQKAVAAGIPGIQIDGNDIIAARQVCGEAIAGARSGSGPTVIEAITFRMGDHTTADDASRYRKEELVSAAWKLDPLARLRNYLANRQWWTKADEEQLIVSCRDKVEAAVAEYLKLPPPSPGEMFDHLFETLPPALEWQRKQFTGGSR
jgi:2-oxoisovalerate dehydrogenase E1 component alpha subunit